MTAGIAILLLVLRVQTPAFITKQTVSEKNYPLQESTIFCLTLNKKNTVENCTQGRFQVRTSTRLLHSPARTINYTINHQVLLAI